ncbi:putative Rho protein GDP-dissociation inhibitor [Helianthus annuus]|uniref:Rho protein GDP-dissociation inhibitor n=1 Tax=Helianthus annuus TaxID=4232 RepID=A0A9K3NEY0_HELAN|nr:putative Rho protein GDP-dissociation inhibitor [Helianthus annuus]KAJ0549672.1 putative Rho protein GDP-dissociation inhibitor [Helianthus annuus]KAJ0556148.1 putative Rho protein GDP-dissociation inhibitor [Helianthus annuus]KAJ0562627.1 putative Rho protein GDP-dissociation inhibitor [Helianthus annuus]KAJ0728002.1 putative Rho protein GDP-dissociation inhibitor [Helianthus annuus]
MQLLIYFDFDLKFDNKTKILVDSSKQMLGTFSPQAEPYIHVMTEETTPWGIFARGSYSAKTKVLMFKSIKTLCFLMFNRRVE